MFRQMIALSLVVLSVDSTTAAIRCSQSDKECIPFPIEHKGKVYDGCIPGWASDWCFTSADRSMWAYCKECEESSTATTTSQSSAKSTTQSTTTTAEQPVASSTFETVTEVRGGREDKSISGTTTSTTTQRTSSSTKTHSSSVLSVTNHFAAGILGEATTTTTGGSTSERDGTVGNRNAGEDVVPKASPSKADVIFVVVFCALAVLVYAAVIFAYMLRRRNRPVM